MTRGDTSPRWTRPENVSMGRRFVDRLRGKEKDMSKPFQILKDGEARVVSLTMDGQTCIWDNIEGLQEELELFWTEGEGQENELMVRFYQMDKDAVDALPEFWGW